MSIKVSVAAEDYATTQVPAWCPGCGNFGILPAVVNALVTLQLAPHQVLLVSGIGQAGKLPHYIKCNVFNGLHGRTLPAATAAKLANRELAVIAVGGDGDGYGEGGNHFLHALRRNPDITYIVHDNQVYGLTLGQTSPTSDPGYISATTPRGAYQPVHPIALAIAAGGTFVARGFAGNTDHLAGLIGEAIRHRGFGYIDVLQPCVTFNRVNTFAWYRQRVYDLASDGHDPADREAAWQRAQEWGERIPIGIFYREERPTFEDNFPSLAGEPLVKRPIDPRAVGPLLEDFK
ncbi:MAG: thiamine pyrophosphate-dependent enzyme [Chloroflexi bacterium]|nr:thiamine pyrophosphate-dependent enzyme [Chloroflexota bacterium]